MYGKTAANNHEPVSKSAVSPVALWSLAKRAWTRRTAVLLTFGPLLSVIAAFVAFAVRNGGIVLGTCFGLPVILAFNLDIFL
jgi:hypothetical protein